HPRCQTMLADVDGDGKQDLVMACPAWPWRTKITTKVAFGQTGTSCSLGSFVSAEHTVPAVAPMPNGEAEIARANAWRILGPDLNSDGKQDLVLYDGSSDGPMLYSRLSTGSTNPFPSTDFSAADGNRLDIGQPCGNGETGQIFSGISIADRNGDGRG